jgi:two-component sensor histidine kinase
MSLAIHELATNAVKYGALSTTEGSVRIDWSIKQDGTERTFEFRWLERNGPRVSPPARRGFGTTVIEKSLASAFEGKISLDYAPDGFSCTVVAPFTDQLGSLR